MSDARERFSGHLLQLGNNTGIDVPAEVVERLGGGKRAAVGVVVNGYGYESTVAVMGGRYLIPFSAERRAETGLAGGDPIEVELVLDTAPRTIPVPQDLGDALVAEGAMGAFERLAPSHRKAHVTSVEGAKTAETRQRRIAAVVAKVLG